MTDIDPKSIPVLDDVIEDDSKDQHAALADETPVVENDDLFSPASLINEKISQAEDDIDHAANIAAPEGNRDGNRDGNREGRHSALDQGEHDTAVHQSDEDTDIQPVSDAIDHTEAVTALDESTPPGGDDLYQEDILNDSMDAPVDTPVVDSSTGPDTCIADNTLADTVHASPSQQPEINTAAVTNQIIDRLMPEIEQRLRIIIDLTLRENLRDKDTGSREPEE